MQSTSGKENRLNKSSMENFLRRLKTEMVYGETFQSADEFMRTLKEYFWDYNNERISLKLKRNEFCAIQNSSTNLIFNFV